MPSLTKRVWARLNSANILHIIILILATGSRYLENIGDGLLFSVVVFVFDLSCGFSDSAICSTALLVLGVPLIPR